MQICCKCYGQNTGRQKWTKRNIYNDPRFGCLWELQRCDPPITNEDKQDRSTVLGAKASIMFVFMMIGLQAVKHVRKNIWKLISVGLDKSRKVGLERQIWEWSARCCRCSWKSVGVCQGEKVWVSCHPGVKPSWSWSQTQGDKAGVRLQRARFWSWSFKILYLYESYLFLRLGVCISETSKSKQQQQQNQKQREDRCLQE